MGSGTRVPTKWRQNGEVRQVRPQSLFLNFLTKKTVSHRSSPSIDCESKEEDSEQESSVTENEEARKQEDSKGARKKKTDKTFRGMKAEG